MAEVILSRPEVLKAHRDELAAELNPLASSNVYASLAIIESGADPAATLAVARAEVDLALEPRLSEPGKFTGYATADRAAIFASVLDQETRNQFAYTTLERALDETQLMFSRWNDLLGLFIITDFIDRETQAAVLPKIMEIARGERTWRTQWSPRRLVRERASAAGFGSSVCGEPQSGRRPVRGD
jgi:hypothetical protein